MNDDEAVYIMYDDDNKVLLLLRELQKKGELPPTLPDESGKATHTFGDTHFADLNA